RGGVQGEVGGVASREEMACRQGKDPDRLGVPPGLRLPCRPRRGAVMTANGVAMVEAPAAAGTQQALPGARAALVLLLAINLFNYIDRQVLAAVIPAIREDPATSPAAQAAAGHEPSLAVRFVSWLGNTFRLGDYALIGSLSMAFIVSYMIFAPVF